MKTLLSLFIALTAHLVVFAQDFKIGHVYPIETDHSYVEFEITFFGYAKVKGSFASFYGSIYHDEENPSETSITFQIDVNSINTNNEWRDTDLKSKNWFLEEEFPIIKFTSTKTEVQGAKLKVSGLLTVKETTKSITLDLAQPTIVSEDIRGDRQVIFVGSYTLNRKEFGVMGANWAEVKEGIAALSDSVTVEFSLIGKQIKEENFKNFLRRKTSPHGAIYASYNEGGIKSAISQCDELRDKEKLSSGALNMVIYMLLLQEKGDDALTLSKYNQKLYPNDADVYDMMGEVYANLNNLEAAKKQYEKAVELDPNNANAKEILKQLD